MSWAIGEHHGRDIGYGVPATCDHPGCGEEIDRGLSFVCGGDVYGGEHGCGLFFCAKHRHVAGIARDHAPLCTRCYWNRPPFLPTPDVPKWMRWKLTDESWELWRQANPSEVAKLRAELARKALVRGRIFHVHLDVGGYLKHATDDELSGMLRDVATGASLTANEARRALQEHLDAGRLVLPMGPACEGFDYTGGGCPGHDKEEIQDA